MTEPDSFLNPGSFVHEEDTVLLWCADGYVFSLPPASVYSTVSIYPQPVNVHTIAFQVSTSENKQDFFETTQVKDTKHQIRSKLVYGKKIALYHVASKRYLSFSETNEERNEIGITNRGFLDDKPYKFKILPSTDSSRIKGDTIHTGDKVILESVEKKGCHLLTIKDSFVLKMAETSSAFTIKSQSVLDFPKGITNLHCMILWGGSVVWFYNDKKGTYLCGSGCTIPDGVLPPENWNIERKFKVYSKKKKTASVQTVSSDCWWQLEKPNNPLDMSSLNSGEHCYIKHMLTGRYLALTDSKELILANDGCRFLLKICKRSDYTDSSCLMVRSSTVSISEKEDMYLSETQSRMPILEASPHSVTFQLCLDKSVTNFKIDQVNHDDLCNLYYVENVKGVLIQYLRELKKNPTIQLTEVKYVLNKLKAWLTTDPVAVRNRVKLLRNTQCIDLLVGYLELEMDIPCVKDICDVLYAIAKAKSHKSRSYLAREPFPVVYSARKHIVHCIGFLSVLVKNGSFIAHSLVGHSILEELHLDASTLNFFASLCIVNGFPEESVQDSICEKIIENDKNTFFYVEQRNNNEFCINRANHERNLSEFLAVRDDDFEFFIAQLSLFSSVCKGINRSAIETVSKKLAPPFIAADIETHHLTVVKAILNAPRIHVAIKSAYLKLITAMYLDDIIAECGPHIENIGTCYLWEKLEPNSDPDSRQPLHGANITTKPFEQVDHPNVGLIRDIIVAAKEGLSNITDYEYTAQMFAVMEPVIAHGFCWNVKNVPTQQRALQQTESIFGVQMIVNLLSSTLEDVDEEHLQDVFKIQNRALRMLQLFFKQFIYLYVEQFLYHFYDKFHERDNNSDISYFEEDISEYFIEDNRSQFKQFSEHALQKLKELDDYRSFDYKSEDGQKLFNILMSIMACDNEELKITSAQLLYDMYFKEYVMLGQAEMSFIREVRDKDDKVYDEMISNTDSRKFFKNLNLGSEKEDEVKDIVEFLLTYEMCILCEEDPTKVLSSFQNIYHTTGMYTALMSYVLKFCASHAVIKPEFCASHAISTSHHTKGDFYTFKKQFFTFEGEFCKRIHILRASCHTLQLICRANPKIQESIASNLSDFMKVNMAVSSVARLLTEVFTNNKKLCDSLSDTDINQLYQLASKGNQESTKEYMEFFTTLEAIMMPCKSTGIPLKRIQVMVIELFSETHADDYKSINKRQVLETCADNEVELLMCLHLTSLMSVCCVGNVQIAEDICHDCITMDQLINIITSRNIAAHLRKIPFAHLLVEAFLCTERKSVNSTNILASKGEFWDHISQFDISTFKPIMMTAPGMPTLNEMKHYLHRIFSYYQTWTEVFNLKIEDDTFDFKENVVNCRKSVGCLRYLIEGLSPLLSAICNQVSLQESQTKLKVDVLQKFGSNLMSLLNSRKSVMLTTQTQATFWSDCLTSINNVAPLEGYRDVKDDYNSEDATTIDNSELVINSNLESFIINNKMICGWLHPTNEELAKLFAVNNPTDTRSRPIHRLFDSTGTKSHPDIILCDLLDALYNQLCHPLTSKKRAILHDTVSHTLQTLRFVPVKCFERCFQSALQHLVYHNDDVTFSVLDLLDSLVTKADDNERDKIYSILAKDNVIFLEIHKIITKISQLGHNIMITVNGKKQEQENSVSSPPSCSAKCFSSLCCCCPDTKIAIEEDSSTPMRDLFSDTKICILVENGSSLLDSVGVALHAVSAFCDGQRWKLQELMREQQLVSINSINIVSDVAELLQSLVVINITDTGTESSEYGLVKEATRDTIQALIEMCAGNYANQLVALDGQVVDSINTILAIPPSAVKCDYADIIVRSKAIELLQILLEETHERSHVTILTVSKYLNRQGIVDFIKYIYEMEQATNDMKRSMYRSYHVLRYLADFHQIEFTKFIPKPDEAEASDKDKKMWEELEKETCRIEINYITKEDKPIFTNVYFPYDPLDKWSDDQKDKLQDEVVRDPPEGKLRDLLKWTDSAWNIEQHKRQLQKYFLTRHFISLSYIKELILHWILIILTLLLNLIVLGIFEIPSTHNCTNDDINSSNNTEGLLLIPHTWECWSTVEMVFLYGFGIIHLVLAVWMMVRHFLKEKPNFVFSIPFIQEELYNLKASVSKDSKKVSNFFENHFTFDKQVESQCFNIYFFGLYSMYRIVFVISSLLGLTTYGYFYCLCLPYIFIKVNVIQHLVKAVGGKAIQLLFVALLILCILLIYAVLSFAIMSSFFDISNNLFCDSLWECYVTVIREGLVNSFGGAIPVTYVEQSGHSFNVYFWRSVIDISFFVIVSVIALEIITAILVDRFSQLREQKEAAIKDQKDSCFICGLSSDTFGTEFSKHYRDHHNMYNYIYFVIHVKSMQPQDHNAIEKYVYEKVKAMSIDFYPLKRKE